MYMKEASTLFRLLGDEARLRLLRLLEKERLNVSEFLLHVRCHLLIGYGKCLMLGEDLSPVVRGHGLRQAELLEFLDADRHLHSRRLRAREAHAPDAASDHGRDSCTRICALSVRTRLFRNLTRDEDAKLVAPLEVDY